MIYCSHSESLIHPQVGEGDGMRGRGRTGETGMWVFGPRSHLQHMEGPGTQRVEMGRWLRKGCWDARVDGELCDKVSAWKKDAAAPKCESALPESALPGVKRLNCTSVSGGESTTIPTEQPGLQGLCPCIRTWPEEEPRAPQEGVSEYFCNAWTSRKDLRSGPMGQFVLG